MATLYETIGSENIDKIVDELYDIISQDIRINYLFKNIDETKRRQKQFLTQFLGGPIDYSNEHGEPQLRRVHQAIPLSRKEAIAWLEDMKLAISHADISPTIQRLILEKLSTMAQHFINKY